MNTPLVRRTLTLRGKAYRYAFSLMAGGGGFSDTPAVIVFKEYVPKYEPEYNFGYDPHFDDGN